MIAVQLYSRDHVEKALGDAGCQFVEQIDDWTSLWVAPLDFYFTVPQIGEDKMCPRVVLFEILADVERHRPPAQ